MQLLVSRHSNRIDFTTWFDMCPLTIACSNRSVDMIMVLLEVGYHTKYDIHRALLEAVQSDNHNEEENEICRSEIINLLIEAGASPHLPVAITRFPEHHFVTDDQIPTMNRQMNSAHSKTPLMAAVCSGDIIGVKAMLNSYSLALPSLRDARRCDPLIRTQPESYFEMLDRKENDMIESSLQVCLSLSRPSILATHSIFRPYCCYTVCSSNCTLSILKPRQLFQCRVHCSIDLQARCLADREIYTMAISLPENKQSISTTTSSYG